MAKMITNYAEANAALDEKSSVLITRPMTFLVLDPMNAILFR